MNWQQHIRNMRSRLRIKYVSLMSSALAIEDTDKQLASMYMTHAADLKKSINELTQILETHEPRKHTTPTGVSAS